MKRHDINIIGLRRMPTMGDLAIVHFVTPETDPIDAWNLIASVLPAAGDIAQFVPACDVGLADGDFDCVSWHDGTGWWFLPADIFIWKST